jgi:hypothetical protein
MAKTFLAFIEFERSQELATGSCPESDETSAPPYSLFLYYPFNRPIIFPSVPTCPKGSFPISFHEKNVVVSIKYIHHFSHACYPTCPSYPSKFEYCTKYYLKITNYKVPRNVMSPVLPLRPQTLD